MAMPPQKPGRSKQDYETPYDFLQATKRMLDIRDFSFDYACSRQNCKAIMGWTEKDDSLSRSVAEWSVYSMAADNNWGWLNPPYADIQPWVVRALETSLIGGRIAFLVPASVGSNWYRDFIHEQFGVQTLFLNGRLCFVKDWQHTINPTTGAFYTSEPLYPKDCVLVLFGTDRDYNADVWTWK